MVDWRVVPNDNTKLCYVLSLSCRAPIFVYGIINDSDSDSARSTQ